MSGGRMHVVIPDVQCRPDEPFAYLEAVGNYIATKRPDTIVCLGDFADMASLSSYDKGKKSFEGRRYKADVSTAHRAMSALCNPWLALDDYAPDMHLTLGNHEDRINRAVESAPELEGTISTADLGYEHYGWRVHEFLRPVSLDGVLYAHYFTSGVMGRPVSSARALVSSGHLSAIMGHVQKDETFTAKRADGTRITGVFAGTCNRNYEQYLGPQGNDYWRGIWVLYEVAAGQFAHKQVSLDYLERHYK